MHEFLSFIDDSEEALKGTTLYADAKSLSLAS